MWESARNRDAHLLFDGGGVKLPGQIRFGAVCDGEAVGAISLRTEADSARLASVYVAPHRRRQGIATLMITLAERFLAKSKITYISAYFPDDAEGLLPFLEAQGYFTSVQEGYYRVKLADLLKAENVKTLMKKGLSDRLTVKSFASLGKNQKNEMKNLLSSHGFRLNEEKLPNMDIKLSGAVFDEEGTMQMCLIASANPSMVFIDHLAVKKTAP